MKFHINILKFLLFCLTVVSCEEIKTRQKSDKIELQNKAGNRYTKIISEPANKLADKIENLEIEYAVWGCACANWIQTKDIKDSGIAKNYLKLHFYIEPAADSLELPIYFDAFRHRLKVTGQFYEREGYPKGTVEIEEPMPKSKVFRYTKIEVIYKPDFKPESKVKTMTLTYNAISCTCAQWSETRFKNTSSEVPHYWLEPANEKLIDAEDLFDGINIPVIIKVTGQVVTENGFPKRKLGKVGQEEAGKVFRYSKIEVIQVGEKKNGR